MLVQGGRKLTTVIYHQNGTGIMMTLDQYQAVHHQMITEKKSIFKILQFVAAVIFNFQF